MKVLFIASECTPFIKSGGLADVVGTLPKALANLGNDVRVILPKYRDIMPIYRDQMEHQLYFNVNLGWRSQYCGIEMLEMEGVTYYFVDNEFYFGRDGLYGDGQGEGERFGFFCKAVLEALPHIGFCPDILHANDWQTGMVCALHKMHYINDPFYSQMRSIFTIHNLRYQGNFSFHYIADILGIDDRFFAPDLLEFYGMISFLKGGIVFADHITTVSPSYAEEIQHAYYGERMDGLLRARSHELTGILNGIDPNEYNPEHDIWLPAHFSKENLENKTLCKLDLQRELGLEQRTDVPLIAIITRLCDQKGLDLIACVLDEIMQNDVQLVVLGKGEANYEELFCWSAWRYQGQLACRIELNTPLSHRIYAASDMFLMPSAFEPCGLSQMISMRYGCIPIVRETGGLRDSVQPYNKYTGKGNGFSFANYNAHEMLFTIETALSFFNDKPCWQSIMKQAMDADFSWDRSAHAYIKIYEMLVAQALESQRIANEIQKQNEKKALTKASTKPSAKKTKAAEEPTAKKTTAKKITKKADEAADEKPAKKATTTKAAATKKPAAKKKTELDAAKAEEKPTKKATTTRKKAVKVEAVAEATEK